MEISFRLFTFCLSICALIGSSSAQVNGTSNEITRSKVLENPPKISFGEWKEVADLESGTEYLESFPSSFNSGYPKNDLVPLRVFVPAGADGPVPIVLIAHYWGATDLKAESALASDLNQKGIGAAILTLPFHMERTPPGAKSGEMAIRPDPESMKQMMFQSQQDAKRALDFFDTRPEFRHDRYGMVGISLGALVAALTFATDQRLSEATFALGGAGLAHIVWNSSRVVPQKEALRRQGWTEERLRGALDSVEPLNYLPRIQPTKTLVISGKYDTVMPLKSTTELIDKLTDPQVIRLGTGHYGGIFVQSKILHTVTDFFEATLNGKTYIAPTQFSALTLRLGGLLAYPQGADLGAGIDFFHLDQRGKTFGTVFVTPRGFRVFLGQSIGGGFSVGAVGSTRGVGAGLMWSVVL